MKKSFMLVAVALLAFAGSAFAQNTATGTGNASARIILPISVGQDQALSFGTFFAGATSGVVHVTSNTSTGSAGSRSKTGGVTLYTGSQGISANQAEWSIEGEPGFLYTITGISGSHTVASGANNMSYTFDAPTANGTVGTIGVDAPGDTDDVFYGAQLSVGASQASGTYTGTYSLTATYN